MNEIKVIKVKKKRREYDVFTVPIFPSLARLDIWFLLFNLIKYAGLHLACQILTQAIDWLIFRVSRVLFINSAYFYNFHLIKYGKRIINLIGETTMLTFLHYLFEDKVKKIVCVSQASLSPNARLVN